MRVPLDNIAVDPVKLIGKHLTLQSARATRDLGFKVSRQHRHKAFYRLNVIGAPRFQYERARLGVHGVVNLGKLGRCHGVQEGEEGEEEEDGDGKEGHEIFILPLYVYWERILSRPNPGAERVGLKGDDDHDNLHKGDSDSSSDLSSST